MPAAKHFNRGNVWGRILTAKADDKGRYLQLKLDCASEKYGKVKTYGRIWGKDRMKPLREHFKTNRDEIIRFTGFFQQYEKDGKTFSNFTFYEWTPAPDKECRAAFILVGVLSTEDLVDGETRLTLDLVRDGVDNSRPVEESLQVWVLSEDLMKGIAEGDVIEVKGIIRPREPEDEYGGSGGEIKPYAMAIVKRGQE